MTERPYVDPLPEAVLDPKSDALAKSILESTDISTLNSAIRYLDDIAELFQAAHGSRVWAIIQQLRDIREAYLKPDDEASSFRYRSIISSLQTECDALKETCALQKAELGLAHNEIARLRAGRSSDFDERDNGNSDPLLPCPFCGGGAYFVDRHGTGICWKVCCDTCSAEIATDHYKAYAARSWNKRFL